MNIKPVKTKKDYEAALKKIDELWKSKPNTHERDTLDILTTLVEVYEQKHKPIQTPDPVEAIKSGREQLGLKHNYLDEAMGKNKDCGSAKQ